MTTIRVTRFSDKQLHKKVKSEFEYNPKLGEFYKYSNPEHNPIGKSVRFNNVMHTTKSVAYLYHTGKLIPPRKITCIDGNPMNLRDSNLFAFGSEISYQRVRLEFGYNKYTKLLYRNSNPNQVLKTRIRVGDKVYRLKTVAYLFHKGEIKDTRQIMVVDGDELNSSPENLKLFTFTLTWDMVNNAFEYDKKTGELLKRFHNYCGSNVTKKKYCSYNLKFYGRNYIVPQLIYFLVTKKFVNKRNINIIDGNKHNTMFENINVVG